MNPVASDSVGGDAGVVGRLPQAETSSTHAQWPQPPDQKALKPADSDHCTDPVCDSETSTV